MSRSWLGRPTGRHAAGRRGRSTDAGPAEAVSVEEAPPPPTLPGTAPAGAAQAQGAARPGGAGLFGAPTMADVPVSPLSPVTEETRAAAAGTSPAAFVPPWAAPLVTIDALGRKCPIPIIMLAGQIRDVPVGSVIAVLADDPAAFTDIPAWCGLKSHDCVFRVDHASGWSFGIRRRY
ncbi:MAG: sulfurtransferase TusA family protein [Trebonia sp.]